MVNTASAYATNMVDYRRFFVIFNLVI